MSGSSPRGILQAQPWRLALALALLSAGSLAVYLLASALTYRVGFPLDDAWIHQVYARNLAARGEWSFMPGEPSAGSTAPLWSIALAVGHWLGLPATLWAMLLGWLALISLGLVGSRFLIAGAGLDSGKAGWLAAFLLLEWHLVWAAGSGMETLAMAVIALAVLTLSSGDRPPWLWIGVLGGLSAWIRPDGITLLGPAALLIYFKERAWESRMRLWVMLAGGWLAAFGPYLIFNRLLAGAWWPNTFYAKQAEYLALRELSFPARYLGQLQLPLVGVGALLLPGFIYMCYLSWQQRRWSPLAAAMWWLGYLGIYAWRLPVQYQHGRYLIPAMPVYLLLGAAGLLDLARALGRTPWGRIVTRAWLSSAAVILLVFWGLGAQAYARDVAFIESEMVAMARWIEVRTPSDALIAAHDIGAVGYFGGRKLVDLAGLVSPDVIPFIRDEKRLASYLDEVEADYLVTFPGWYPALVAEAQLVHQSKAPFAPAQGGENMALYRWGHASDP